MRRTALLVALVVAAAAYPDKAHSDKPYPDDRPRRVCPGAQVATPPSGKDEVPSLDVYKKAVSGLDISAVLFDIVALLTDSQSCWPADTAEGSLIGKSYGGLFVRLAWHCSGTFRQADGKGGCGGGRIRFPPESDWRDNVNLDKARSLLLPIKKKYGDALSWGDLYVLAGTGSILHMGGPVTQVCVGRVDDHDGKASVPLDGPPRGAAEPGLIYVNPEGLKGEPDPVKTAPHVREVFKRMGMNDEETVALIGGGHAFGRSHGACPLGAGPPPNVQPLNPWPGNCGSGKGKDTVSSGIEGAWTSDPFKWDNEYFELLYKYGSTYRLRRGPGGAFQWYTPAKPELMMQTTDLALVHDPDFAKIVKEFATKPRTLNKAFAKVWEKLTHAGEGFDDDTKRCIQPGRKFTALAIRHARRNARRAWRASRMAMRMRPEKKKSE